MPKESGETVDAPYLATLFDETVFVIEGLARTGEIPKKGHGKYDLGPCITAYVKYLKDPNRIVSGAYLATFMGLVVRTIERLALEGTIPKKGRGRYPLQSCVRAYLNFLTKLGEGTDLSLTDERKRETRLKADILEMESAKMKGGLVDKGLAVEIWQNLFGAFKAKLGSATARMRSIINNIKTKEDKREANEFLSTLHREALDELSGIQEADYTGDEGSPDSDKAASGDDDKPVGRRKKAAKPRVKRRVRKVPNKKG